MTQETITAVDGKQIVCSLWDDVTLPKAVVQLIHGMNEHVGRYDRFARFLNAHGYIVFGDDHRGHGRTAASIELIGKPDGETDLFDATLRDELLILKMLRERYQLPVLLFGHSYGSFITQRIIDICSDHKAVCLCGSAKYPYPAVQMIRFVMWLCKKMTSPEADAKLVARLSFMRGTGWVTRDLEQAALFQRDPYRKDLFSYGFYHSLFKNLAKIKRRPNKSIPMLIISGSQDAVGGRGMFINALYKAYERLNMSNLTYILYEGAKHELLNETNYRDVQDDILNFFEEAVK